MNKIFLKRNKYIILAYLVIIVMTFLSIFNYCKDNYIFQESLIINSSHNKSHIELEEKIKKIESEINQLKNTRFQ